MELRLEILANCIECLKALQHKKISVIINQNIIIISTKESNMDVIVIGAGASGLLAAYEASKKCKVYVIELKDVPGKKILATGNGKCNLTNKHMFSDCYNENATSFVDKVLKRYSYEDMYQYFSELPIMLDDEKDYIYPYSKQSKTIVNELYNHCLYNNVEFIFNSNVKNIEKEKGKFTVSYIQTENKESKKKTICADKVVVACGGKVASKLGSDGSGYYLMRKLGHTITECVPALVPLVCDKSDKKYLEILKGVRSKAKVYTETGLSSVGELQMTDYGISGIVVFQLSGKINRYLIENKEIKIYLDFTPDIKKDDIIKFINKAKDNESKNKISKDKYYISNINVLLSGFLNDKIIEAIALYCKDNNIDASKPEEIADIIKKFPLTVVSSMGFENAQVTSGGINLEEVDENMESKLVSSLYITGELLDVDGICGGYNLHFAFASGIIAGKSILEKA